MFWQLVDNGVNNPLRGRLDDWTLLLMVTDQVAKEDTALGAVGAEDEFGRCSAASSGRAVAASPQTATAR